MKDPEERAKQRRYQRKYMKKQRRTAAGRATQREATRRYQQKLRRSKPELVAQRNAVRRERRRLLKEQDPEGYRRVLEQERLKRLREKEAREAGRRAREEEKANPVLVDPAPLAEFVRTLFIQHDSEQGAALALGIDASYLRKIRDCGMHRISLDDVDRVFTAAGRPDLLVVHYPVA